MPTPLYLQLAKDQRMAYLTREAALTGDLAKLYAGAEKSVEARITLLEQQLVTAQLPETRESKQFLLARLRKILEQIREELKNPSARAAQLVTANQLTAAQMATDGALAMTRAVGITSPFATLPADALHHLAGHMQDGTPLSDVFSRYGDEAAESMKQVLFTGVAQGVGAAKIATGLIQAVRGLTRYKALQIGRTESMRAQRAAAVSTYRQNDDIISGYRWRCENLPSTCLVCLEMDGEEFTLDDMMGAPHPCCRCACVPVYRHHRSDWGQTGHDWFEDQEPETKVKMMGPSMYSLYAGGHITLPDLVDKTHSQWGTQYHVKSVVQLYREGRITADHMDEAYDYAKISAIV